MILDTTTRSIQIILAGAVTTNQLNVTAAWVDMTTSSVTPGATVSNSNSTTAVAIVAAPAASTQRKVSNLSVYNADTVSATVTVRYNDNGTFYPLISVALPPKATLAYTDTGGWMILNASGVVADPKVVALSIISGVVNIDCSLADYFTLAMTANVTSLTFSNLPASGRAATKSISIQQDATGGRTLALPASFKATGGTDTAIQSAANAYTKLVIESVDQGTRWAYAMQDVA